jgi:hypothetical protein
VSDQSAAPRRRSPRYTVFALRALQEPATGWCRALDDGEALQPGEPGDSVDAWVQIADDVEAPSARAAITAATEAAYEKPDDPRRFGTFAVALNGDFRVLKRTLDVPPPQEVWS